MKPPVQYIQIPVIYEKTDEKNQIQIAVDESDRTILAAKLKLLTELDRLELKREFENQFNISSS